MDIRVIQKFSYPFNILSNELIIEEIELSLDDVKKKINNVLTHGIIALKENKNSKMRNIVEARYRDTRHIEDIAATFNMSSKEVIGTIKNALDTIQDRKTMSYIQSLITKEIRDFVYTKHFCRISGSNRVRILEQRFPAFKYDYEKERWIRRVA